MELKLKDKLLKLLKRLFISSIAVWDLIILRPDIVSSMREISSADCFCILAEEPFSFFETKETTPPTKGTTTRVTSVSTGLRHNKAAKYNSTFIATDTKVCNPKSTFLSYSKTSALIRVSKSPFLYRETYSIL